MITLDDLNSAIAECHGKRNPDANTCIMLAAFYTLKQNLYPEKAGNTVASQPTQFQRDYSYSNGPDIMYSGDSEFARTVYGRNPDDVMPVIDELMETIKVVNPRLYSGVMRRLQ